MKLNDTLQNISQQITPSRAKAATKKKIIKDFPAIAAYHQLTVVLAHSHHQKNHMRKSSLSYLKNYRSKKGISN